jgi:fructose/tagatose bisphosphate aldolase
VQGGGPAEPLHGGSGSGLHEIHEALDYGVVKMNVDSDMQHRGPEGNRNDHAR